MNDKSPVISWDYLGEVPYLEAWELQLKLKKILKKEPEKAGFFLLLTHPKTFTEGKRDASSYFKKNKSELKKLGFEIVKTDRGGLVTYHGPGQMVGYGILNLKVLEINGIREYIKKLENILVGTCKYFEIPASIKDGFPGAWVYENKIGATGAHLDKNITTHGFSLNVDPDMSHFDYITACGIDGAGLTSFRELDVLVEMEDVAKTISGLLEQNFHARMRRENIMSRYK